MKLARNVLKQKVEQKMERNLKLRGEQKADVTDLWDDNEATLRQLFQYGNWVFQKDNEKVYLQKKII